MRRWATTAAVAVALHPEPARWHQKQLELGDAEVMGELFASFGLAMLRALCIYIVLVLLFMTFCTSSPS